VSNRAVSKWENGLSFPSTETCYKLADVFKISLDVLMNGEMEQTRSWQKSEGMESLKELYRIGRGPSSSHSMAPERACIQFREENQTADCFKVVLYGSLAKMGKGHRTEYVIHQVFKDYPHEIEFDKVNKNIPHPNTMDVYAFKENKQVTNDFYVLFNFQITTYKLELKKEEIIDYYKTFFGDYCVKDYGLALNAKNSFLLKDVCNWIIHSYVWSLGDLQDERKISGFFVSSDRDKVKYCNYINIDDWAKALKHCAKNAYL